MVHPDIRSSADHSSIGGYSRLGHQRVSSGLNISNSQRSLNLKLDPEYKPGHQYAVRREQKRLIDLENMKIANKLMTVRGSKDLKKDTLETEFDRHMRAKAVLCKLPIINMA